MRTVLLLILLGGASNAAQDISDNSEGTSYSAAADEVISDNSEDTSYDDDEDILG